MVDFDWRLDVKISSKTAERTKQPILYVKMDLEEPAKSTTQTNHRDAPKNEVLF